MIDGTLKLSSYEVFCPVSLVQLRSHVSLVQVIWVTTSNVLRGWMGWFVRSSYFVLHCVCGFPSFQVPAFSPSCASSILEPPDQIFAHRKKIAWHLAPRTVQSCEFQVIWCDMWYVQSVGSKFWQFRDHLALKTGCTTFYNVVFWIIDGTSPGLNFPKNNHLMTSMACHCYLPADPPQDNLPLSQRSINLFAKFVTRAGSSLRTRWNKRFMWTKMLMELKLAL